MSQAHPFRAYAASLTAAALIEMFPKVTLLSAMPRRFGFSVTATIPDGIQEEAFSLIEERIPEIQKRPLKQFDMVGSNAATFLRHHNQVERAKQVDKAFEARIIQIGEFVDLCPYEIDTNMQGYRLLELIDHKTHIEIIGCAYPTQEEARQFARNYKNYKALDHTNQIEWHEGQPIISGEHEEMYFALVQKWRQWVKDNGGELYRGAKAPKGVWSATMRECDGAGLEGLLDMPGSTACILNGAPERAVQEGIASLGLKIEEERFAPDAYGMLWPLAEKNTFYTSVERIFALMLEQKIKP